MELATKSAPRIGCRLTVYPSYMQHYSPYSPCIDPRMIVYSYTALTCNGGCMITGLDP